MANFIPATPRNDTIHSRQIAFAAAFLLPVSKLLEAPSILAQYAAGDLLLPALLHFLLQSAVLAGLLYAASRSETPLLERLQNALGGWTVVFYALYAVYFVFSVLLPILDLEKFVYAAFFDTAPTMFSFAFFFILCAFVCSKGIKTVGRLADLCLFLFLFPFLALIAMSLAEADFTNLLPLFGTKFGDTMSAFTRVTPHFSDAILLLPLIGSRRYKKGDAPKIMAGYWAGALCVFLFLAVFFGTYSSIAARQHYAFSKIAQYFPALSVIGRIDLIFVYLLSATLFFFTCLPLQYATDLVCRCVRTERRTLFAAILSFGLFLFTLFCNKYYNSFYAVISGNLFSVFWLIADLVPLFLIFLPRDRRSETQRSTRKKEARRV